jgi:predicted nucleotidyltransferase
MANITEKQIVELINQVCQTAHLIGSRVEFDGRFARPDSDWDILVETEDDFNTAKTILDWWGKNNYRIEKVVVKEKREKPVYDQRALRYEGVHKIIKYEPIMVDVTKKVKTPNQNKIDLVLGKYIRDERERKKKFIENHIEQFVDCSVKGLRAWALANLDAVLDDYETNGST